MGAHRRVWWLSVLAVTACVGSTLRSQPLTASGFDLEVERGTIEVVPAMMKQAVVGDRRLDLTDLINVDDVFKAIDGQLSASAMQSQSVVTSLLGGVTVGATAGDAGSTSGEGGGGGDDGGASPPAAAPSPPTLTAPYHEVLLSAVQTVLGGQALQDLYDVDSVPQGYGLYAVPVVASFTPGTVTGTNYSAEASLQLCAGVEPPLGDFRIIAAAPAGFTRIVSDTASDVDTLALGAALTGQIGQLAATGAFSRVVTQLRELSQVDGVAQFQVAIPDSRTVKVRYFGNQTGSDSRVTLSPATFNSEILVIATEKALERCALLPAGASRPPPGAQAPGTSTPVASMFTRPNGPTGRFRIDTVGSATAKLVNRNAQTLRPESGVYGFVGYASGGEFVPVFERSCPLVGSCGDRESYEVKRSTGSLPVQHLTADSVTVADVQELAGGRLYITGDQFDAAALCVDVHRGDTALTVEAAQTLVTARSILVQTTGKAIGSPTDPLTLVLHASADNPQLNGTYQPTLCSACNASCGLRVFELAGAPPPTSPAPVRALDEVSGHFGPTYALFQVTFELPSTEKPSFLVDGRSPKTVVLDFPKGNGKGRAILQVDATLASGATSQRFVVVLGDKTHVYDSRAVTLSY